MKKVKADDIKLEIENLISRLKELKKEHGDSFEYNLQTAIYDKNGIPITYKECIELLNPYNHDFYKKRLSLSKSKQSEYLRFKDFLALGEYIVICDDDSISGDLLESFMSDGAIGMYDWISKDKIYIVTGHRISDEGLCFSLRTQEGYDLLTPADFEGFNSLRFSLADYTKLN